MMEVSLAVVSLPGEKKATRQLRPGQESPLVFILVAGLVEEKNYLASAVSQEEKLEASHAQRNHDRGCY